MTTPTRLRDAALRTSRLALAAALVLAGCATRTPAPVVDRQAVPPRAAPAPVAPAPVAQPAPAPAPASPPEPDWRPPTYTVKRGDTLYQIALEHGLDYRELAAWNAIENINLIRVGQVLKLTAPGTEAGPAGATTAAAAPGSTGGGTLTAPLRTVPPVGTAQPGTALASTSGPAGGTAVPAPPSRASDAAIRTSPRAIKEPWSEQAMKEVARSGGAGEPATVARADPSPRPAPASTSAAPGAGNAQAIAGAPAAGLPAPAAGASPGDDEGLGWVWPAKGKLVAQFSESASLKGIDIAGGAGEAVVASAPGKVVYAGTGLRGYGKLVIVKHNATYLSAYAHNREILVKEGQNVARGQKIAEMGSTDADQVKLHFEIRRLGRPMDPLRFLPPA